MKNRIIILIGFTLFLASCAEVNVNEPYGSKQAPAKVSVREVINRAGAATIFYTLPDDDNLKYVKAVYTPRQNTTSEMIASIYTDSLVVEGFEKEGDYTVELYSVSHGGTQSDPVKITVSPLRPPYLSVLDNLSMREVFGGFDMTAKNPDRAKLFFSIYQVAGNSSYELLSNFSSEDTEIFKGIRGLASEPQEFAVKISDHWGNASDYKTQSLTPYEEQECDKSAFSELALVGDSPIRTWSANLGNAIKALWDGNCTDPITPVCQWISTTGFPSHISFDMGKEYILSRFVYWPRWCGATNYDQLFRDTDIRRFEMYGALELNPDSSRPLYDSDGVLDPYWTLLGTFENKRESGTTENAVAVALSETEKSNYATAQGREFFFSDPYPVARYIRIRTLMTWGKSQQCSMNEMTLYGQEH